MFNLKPSLAVTQNILVLLSQRSSNTRPASQYAIIGFTIERRTALLKLILADWWRSAYEVVVSTDELKTVLESDGA